MDGLIANMQYVIGIIASFALQGFKKVPFVDTNKQWLVPLTLIVICVGTCAVNVYCLGHLITNWVLTGTTMALAICKVYDWLNQ